VLISKFFGDKSDVSLRNRSAILMKANMVREVSRFGDLDDADWECSDIGQTDFLEESCPFSNSILNSVSIHKIVMRKMLSYPHSLSRDEIA
jgi:hypothetical protein